MKKLSLLIYYKDYQRFLGELREKGVIHIHENPKRSAEDEQLQARLREIRRITEMIRRLEGRVSEKTGRIDVEDEKLLDYLDEQFKRRDQISQQLTALEKEISLFEPWGNYSRERVEGLKDAGWDLRFFTVPGRKYLPEWEEKYNANVISEQKGQTYFVTVMPVGEEGVPEADHFTFPEETEEAIRGKIISLKDESEKINEHLNQIAADSIERLKNYREQVNEITDSLHVNNSSKTLVDEKVVALEGWIPKDKEESMREFLNKEEVFYEFSRPTPDEDVPVLLKNNRFNRLFEPIGAMYSLPNYRELDVTPFFAPFFMLFFGLCMGDGGYGLLIWLVCFLLRRKVADNLKGYLKLGEYLGLATMVVGILTGSFFGIALDSVTWPWLQGVKQYFVTQGNFGEYFGGYNPMMFVAFALGIIQILFGMCIDAAKRIKQFGFKYALSTIGWVVLLVTAMVIFGLPALGVNLPQVLTYVGYGLIGISALAILFINSPDKNIFVNFGSGIWNTYNMATGLLGDILSYVRLFALGLTGSILGSVFNMLAFDMTTSLPSVARYIVVFLILIIGHGLNFAIAMIGALVHPMRLTFVEFYKNAGFEGGGKKYSPFKRRVN